MSDQDQLIEQFMNVTSSSKYLAEQYLNRNKNDVVNAIEDFYANHSVSGQQTPQSSRGNKPKS
jgi:UBX domain-containing protein 1